MKPRSALVVGAVLLLAELQFATCAFPDGRPAVPPISYQVSLDHPERHLFHVVMQVPDVRGELTVELPAWNALYQIRDFSSHVQQVKASVEDQKLPIEKIDKQTWKIEGSGTVRIDYTTYWDEAGPFAAQLNSDHAFINPAMILLYVPGKTEDPAQITLLDIPADWHAAGALKLQCEAPVGAPVCTSDQTTYNKLVDAPIEIGRYREFAVPGVPADIRVAVHGENWNEKEITGQLSRICNYELKLMGGAPFQHYLFILHIGKGAGGGGMEHADSTAIGIPSVDYLPGVAAHEFFHLWNVKRIRPASLWPVDFTKEQYTRALWFAEGVTSTFGAFTLVRTGIWSKDRFYDDLGDQISSLEERPANRWQSVEQSSLDAWLEKYPMYDQSDFSISYYTKGQILGDLLDILIRDRTDNEKSLDDVLRAMNADFAEQGRAYRDSTDVRLEAEKVTGQSFDQFFRDYVAAATPLPYQQVLSRAGLLVRTIEEKRAVLGFVAERDASGALAVRAVDDGSPAAKAGLLPGDVFLSWNGSDPPRFLLRWVRDQHPGEKVKIRVRRANREETLEFQLGEHFELQYQVSEDPQAGERAREIRYGLLHGVTDRVTVH